MTKSAVLRSAAALAIFGLGMATGFVAQTLAGASQMSEQKRADLIGAPNMEVVVSTGEFKKGERINPHVHHGIEVAYVVQGTTVQYPGKDPVCIPTGASVMNLRDDKHGGFIIVSDTPLKIFTVHIVDKDKTLYDYVK